VPRKLFIVCSSQKYKNDKNKNLTSLNIYFDSLNVKTWLRSWLQPDFNRSFAFQHLKELP